MTDYNKSVNFAVKDTLTSGDPNKIVSGAEIDTEFNNISSASTTKIDKVPAAVTNNLASFKSSGGIQDSGKDVTDFADVSVESDVSDLQSDKANKVSGATSGNFAALDSDGDLTDSGETADTIITIASPTASVTAFAGTSAPTGWLFCNGQEISRSTYSDLFSLIGVTFGGGDGSTTFNVPDLRDRFPLGARTIGSSDTERVSNYNTDIGDTGGADDHQLTVDEMPSHKHDLNMRSTEGPPDSSTNNVGKVDDINPNFSRSDNAMYDTGGDQPHNNMPPFLALNYIIKT